MNEQAKEQIEKTALLGSAIRLTKELPDGQVKKEIFGALMKIAAADDETEKNALLAGLGKMIIAGAGKMLKHPVKSLGVGLTGAFSASEASRAPGQMRAARMSVGAEGRMGVGRIT